MNKIIVVPDSFKGGISSEKFCAIAKKAICKIYPSAQVVAIPIADGGEGTVDAFLVSVGGKKVRVVVKNPFFEDMESFYGVLPDKTAVIEMAACAGLPLAKGREDPLITTTFGVGQLIRHAFKNGCERIILAMGGSATNDAGCGMACALGAKFYDTDGNEFIPTGITLCKIQKIDTSGLCLGVPVTAMCDIDNPLFGENGAAYVFAPQKGADNEAVKLLDDGLRHFAQIVKSELGADFDDIKGGGAAGGLGAGAVCFLNAYLQMGIDVILDTAGFECQLDDADLVITGEGRIDTQSLRGKAVIGVAKRAKAKKVPVIAVVGDIGDGIEDAYTLGVSGIFSINRVAVAYDRAILRSENDLLLTIENILHFIKSIAKENGNAS
ncbi:MAG: glycerate kinase [Firmicutes bacterium HGW-Firmicutes-16]|nr:MAG: glycerate kinase [Firmicutes bacterium HGW-Firmicutes-16]